LGDTSALPQEQVILEIYAASGPQIVLDLASLVTELRPRYLRLLCDRPASARTLCETLAQSTAAPVLEDLAIRCSGIDPSIDMSKVMLEIVSMFKHMRMIVISATTQLDTASKEALIAVGNESLFLDSIRFISEIPNLKDPTTDIVFIPAMRLHQGPFQRTYHAAATARFFAVLGLPWDAGAHIAEMGVMDLRTQQALVCVSTATATTAADRRRDLQATLVAEALVDGAFTPGVLRDMLVSSTGACDRALVSAIQQRLQAARDEAALAILNEAVPQ
jgi:hypothetical protein